VFNAAPDGYTLLAAQPAPLTINPVLYKKLNYDPTQFMPIAIMTTIPNVLMVRPDFPAKTPQEFLAYAKANPGKINYASQGIGTTSHLTAALLERMAGIKLVHVPYKGTGPALNDLIASHVDMIFIEVASAIKLHQAGNARILAVAADKRIATLPNVPTLYEVGVKGFASASWNALAAPPKTPPAIVAKLNAAVNEALRSPEAQAHFAALDLRSVGGTTDDAAAFIRSETKVWDDVIKQAGIEAN
jgi:tripartite-type tricarboxylate transporter receptor subunit TctC